MTDDGFSILLNFILIVILLFVICLHDATLDNNDLKLATVLVERNLTIEELDSNQTLFENYSNLRKKFLELHYQRSLKNIKTDSRSVEK